MLTHLAIRNIALIASLDLSFEAGFTALTGETGAGKSLLMDALGLALGERADPGLIRHGQTVADVSATFTVTPSALLATQLEEQGLALEDGTLILRRQIKKEGATTASKAWVNGTPVAAGTLAALAAFLVDIHAQHGTQALLQPAMQRDLLDTLAGNTHLRTEVAGSYQTWQAANAAARAAQSQLGKAQAEADLLTIWRKELEDINYQPEEEITLAAQKARLTNFAQIAQSLATADDALSSERGTLTTLRAASRAISAAARLDATMEPLSARLTSALLELEDAASDIARAASAQEAEGNLETIEERLYALRAAARKHQVEVAALPEVLTRLTQQTTGLAALQTEAEKLSSAAHQARQSFIGACRRLSAARSTKSAALAAQLQQAVQNLQLPHAELRIDLKELQESEWASGGAESVELLLSANPGTPPQPAAKVASGGELSRLMLALKSVLYQALAPQTVIFDEIDTGLSGRAASAVGHAMAALGGRHQVLAITHHPQVAACAGAHGRLSKQVDSGTTTTHITLLTGPARLEELARLLAGAHVTPQARAAAQSLLEESQPPVKKRKAA